MHELQPHARDLGAWIDSLKEGLLGFYERLPETTTYQNFEVDHIRADLDQLKAKTTVPDLIAGLIEGISGAGLLAAGPGHLGFIPGGGLPIAAISDHLSAGLNCFSADAFASPFAVAIHEDAVRALIDVVGYSPKAWGDFCSGASHATYTALHAARRAGSVSARDFERTVIYLSAHTHHVACKAVDLLFGGAAILRVVPLDAHYRMDSKALRSAIEADLHADLKPLLIIATAGSTNLGMIDPLDDIADIAEDFKLWMHVDAAYGGFFALCPEQADRFAGLRRADSIVLDPHKGLFLPYGIGAVLLKDGQHLFHGTHGAYLQDRDDRSFHSPMDYSLELSRPFRSLRLWLALQVHGREAFEKALSEKLSLTSYCHERLQMIPELVLLPRSDLSVIGFYLKHGDTRGLLQRINAHSEVFLSSTMIDETFVIRIAILSFRTEKSTIDRLLSIIRNEVMTP